MSKKIKTQVQKSVDFYGETFASAVWQSDVITVNQDTVGVSYSLYHDAGEANANGVAINDRYNNGVTITVDPPGGRVAAVLAVVAGDSNEEKISALANALLDVVADIEIANSNGKLHEGSKL